jgi:hypothetical protein
MSQVPTFSNQLNQALTNFFTKITQKEGQGDTTWATDGSADYKDFVRAEGEKIARISKIDQARDLTGLFDFLDSIFTGATSYGLTKAEEIFASHDYQKDTNLNVLDKAKLEDIALLHELGHQFSAHDTAMILKNIKSQVHKADFDKGAWLDILEKTTNPEKINDIFMGDADTGAHYANIFDTEYFPIQGDYKELDTAILNILVKKGADLSKIDIENDGKTKAYLESLLK